jgi:hypothetical protein
MILDRRQFAGALLALPFALKAASAGGEEPVLSARERYFAASDWTGFRVSILLRREIAGEPCILREIASDDVLHSGDRIQLRIQPNVAGSLYILSEDQDGACRLLDQTTAGVFQPVMMPEPDWLRFDNEPGIDPVLVVFGRQPVATLEVLRRKDASMSEREMRRLIAAQSADAQMHELERSQNGSIPTIFSVSQLDEGTDLLLERIEFTHRPARRKG